MKNSGNNRKWGDTLAALLRKAAAEVEEFQLQLALGKAEAGDEYEKLKKSIRRLVLRTETALNTAKGKAAEVRGLFEELRVQLALGKADSLQTFHAQKKRVLAVLTRLENILPHLPEEDQLRSTVQHEIEKARIKLDILLLHYRLRNLSDEKEKQQKKGSFEAMLDNMKKKSAALHPAEDRSEHIRRELKAAYKHLRKAFGNVSA